MRAIFWPLKANPNPTAMTRFGRVLHWTACGLSACSALLIIVVMTNGDGLAENISGVVMIALWSAAFFLGGRALRYVLSAE